jgi:hypothetical protein
MQAKHLDVMVIHSIKVVFQRLNSTWLPYDHNSFYNLMRKLIKKQRFWITNFVTAKKVIKVIKHSKIHKYWLLLKVINYNYNYKYNGIKVTE